MVPLLAILVGSLCTATGLVVAYDPSAVYDHRPPAAYDGDTGIDPRNRRRWRVAGGGLLLAGVAVTVAGFWSLPQ